MNNLLYIVTLMVLASCSHAPKTISGGIPVSKSPALKVLQITSPAFGPGEYIPSLYTCDSSDISPQLQWNKPAGKVVSYSIIMEDPDAPMGTWVHWVVYNIPATDTMLPAHYPTDSIMPGNIHQGVNSFRTIGYGGPCPPSLTHRYFIRLFALDTIFGLPSKSTGKNTLTAAMKGHILSVAQLMGRYAKKKK